MVSSSTRNENEGSGNYFSNNLDVGTSQMKRKNRQTHNINNNEPAYIETQNQNNNSNGSGGLILTDPDVLDCPICSETLSIPVFQCKNGHLLCSPCYIKLNNKCPSCCAQIKNMRCRPIEKVLESLKIPCQNTPYGCKEIIPYSEKRVHEETCNYPPCSCPLLTCNFFATPSDLAEHCRDHDCIDYFYYDGRINVSMDISQEYQFYQEVNSGTVFIVRNISHSIGNALSVSCIGPPNMKEGILYDLVIRTSGKGSGLRLRSTTEVVQGLPTDEPKDLTESLIVPRNGSSDTIKFLLLIWKNREQPGLIHIN